MRFFWGGHFEYSKSAILNFFLLHLCEKSSPEVSFFSALWMVFPESWKRSCPNFYAHDCMSVRRDVERDSIWNVSHIYFDSDSRKGTIHTHYFVPSFFFPSQLIPLFTMGWNNFWSKILYLIFTIAFSQDIFLILFLMQKFILITRI